MSIEEVKTAEEYEAERRREHEERAEGFRKDMDRLERAIAPLKFQERERASGLYLSRTILSEAGEDLGNINYNRRGYSSSGPMKFRVTSQRIPSRRYYSHAGGFRDYTKFESAVAAIKKFCIPVSGDEERAKVLRSELYYYRGKVDNSAHRHVKLDHGEAQWRRAPDADRLVELLASDIPQNYLEGQAYLKQLIRQKKVHNRYVAWIKATFIDERKAELESLDLSKERVK